MLKLLDEGRNLVSAWWCAAASDEDLNELAGRINDWLEAAENYAELRQGGA